MPFGASTLLLASLVLQTPESKPDVRTLQFVLGNPSLKRHASVRHNELTISGGAGASYVSSINLGEFEMEGEVAALDSSEATLLLYASVDKGWHATSQITIPFTGRNGTSWQTLRIVSTGGHLTVALGDVTIADQQVPADSYGRLGIDVTRGRLSIRDWRALRRDSGDDPREFVALNPISHSVTRRGVR